MRTWLDAALTALAIILFVPAGLILASWNALPGDSLYSTKTAFEKVALAITIKTPLASMLSLNFTDRRFNEANRLLAKDGSTLGYTLLVAQAAQSKDIIVEKQDTKQAAALIQNIENYQKSIEEKKAVLATAPSAVVPPSVAVATPVAATPAPIVQTPTPVPVPTATAPQQASFTPTTTPPPATPVVTQPTPAPSVEVVINNLEQTNHQLEDLKHEIERDVPQQHSQKPDKGQSQEQDNGHKNQKND